MADLRAVRTTGSVGLGAARGEGRGAAGWGPVWQLLDAAEAELLRGDAALLHERAGRFYAIGEVEVVNHARTPAARPTSSRN